MNTKTLAQLDFFRLRETIAGFCVSSEAYKYLSDRLPLINPAKIQDLKQEGKEWTAYIQSGRTAALISWPEVKTVFPILGLDGAVLELEQIAALGSFCRSILHVKKALIPDSGDLTSDTSPLPNLSILASLAQKLPDIRKAEQHIFCIIDNSGQMRDLPELRSIRQNIRSMQKDCDRLIKSYVNNSRLQDALESTVPVLRSNRQVLAVKTNYRGRIRGIVHEVSQTGQTVYIEPEDLVQKNNELIQEEFHLLQAIRQILKTLTADLGFFKSELEQALELMIHLDASYAAARWGLENRCIFVADCTDEQNLALLQGRHPILGENAVPIDVVFPLNHRVLIITGANTGGKTVSLKTIALFALLNQSGFPIPAQDGTHFPIFQSVFADIGDEQSLDQSLSTFSGHMKNISEVLQGADEHSLVLLDELGSGTDPQEGAAIAMAVLDFLIEKKAFVLITTHQGVLKNYGYTHPACINASVEFGETSLRPTYRILMGVPGESHALDIAKKSGLLPDLIDKAAAYLENKEADVSVLIKSLNKKHEELAILERDIRLKEQLINEKWHKLNLKDLQLKRQELELKEQDCRQSNEFLEKNRKMLENLVRELREGEIDRQKTLKVKNFIEDTEQSVQTEKAVLDAEKDLFAKLEKKIKSEKPQNPSRAAIFTLAPDADVFVGLAKSRGRIIARAKKNTWLVQIGSVKMTIAEKDLQPAPPSSQNNAAAILVEMANKNSGKIETDRPAFELRLLGMRLEDAIKALERQLDLCAVHNLHNFSVIHGKGSGVLQQGIHDYLSHYTGQIQFHFARPEDGGTGKTYVKLG